MSQHFLPGRTPLDIPLMLFLLGAIIGLLVSYDRSLSWALLGTLAGSTALYSIVTRFNFGSAGLRRLAWALIAVQSAFTLYFVTQFDYLGHPVKMGFVSRLGRLTTAPFRAFNEGFPHPNALATFIEGGLFLAVGLWLAARARRKRAAALIGLLILGYGLLLTASRGAWLAVALSTGLGFVLSLKYRYPPNRQATALLVLGVFAVLAGAVLLLTGPDHVPGLGSALSRGVDRAELYRNSLHLARDYPLLGIGLGNTFALVYSKYILLIPHVYLTYSHNLFLAIWLNQGLLGLVSFGWLLIAFYRLVAQEFRQAEGSPLFWGAVLGVTSMLLHGLIDAPQYSENYWVMPVFFALLALSVALAPSTSSSSYDRAWGTRRKAFLALTAAALGIAAIFLGVDLYYTNLGAIEHNRADLAPSLDEATRQKIREQATHYYQRALDFNENQPMAHWRLGLIALDKDQFPQAIEHLELARSALPGHRGVQKALGYAYLWDGQIERAESLLSSLPEVPEELDTWSWWRGSQGQMQLAEYAHDLQLRLSDQQR